MVGFGVGLMRLGDDDGWAVGTVEGIELGAAVEGLADGEEDG